MKPVALLAAVALAASGCDRDHNAYHLEAGDCASCHAEQVEQWTSSPHAVGASSPVFEAYTERVAQSWGQPAADQCQSCHAPSHTADASVTCVTCHAAVGNRGISNGQLVLNLTAPMAGPITVTDTPATGSPHGHRPSGFLASSDLCGTCHEVTAPRLLDEPTYSQFEASPQAARGDTCMTCHMPELAPGKVSRLSKKDRIRRDHRFQGVDPLWDDLDNADHWERVRALLDEALELRIVGHRVEVENVGAGHDVPTGMATLRDIWVDITVVAPDGQVLVTLDRTIVLGDQPYRGAEPVALLTDADRVEHGSLPAGSIRTFDVDEGVLAGPIGHIEATLKFRSFRQEVVQALGLERVLAQVPVLIVAIAR